MATKKKKKPTANALPLLSPAKTNQFHTRVFRQQQSLPVQMSTSTYEALAHEEVCLHQLWLAQVSRVETTTQITKDSRSLTLKKQSSKTPYTSTTTRRKKKKLQSIQKGPQYPPKRQQLELLFQLEARQYQAASRVQRAFRAHRRREFWKLYFIHVRAAVEIQRIVRGVYVRKVVRQWCDKRTSLAIVIQSAVRGYLSRVVRHSVLAFHHLQVTTIQKIIRGYFGRRKARDRKRELAILAIQRLWRGFSGRMSADRRWLEAKATCIQAQVRGYFARQSVQVLAQEYYASSVKIQKIVRGNHVRSRLEAKLLERTRQTHELTLDLLRAEVSWFQEAQELIHRRLTKWQTRATLAELESKVRTSRLHIQQLEQNFLDTTTELSRLSPRALEHGWKESYVANLVEQRKILTREKQQCMFHWTLQLRQEEQHYWSQQEALERLSLEQQTREEAMEELAVECWNQESNQFWQQRDKRKCEAVAAQRRKWQIPFFTSSGKIKKLGPVASKAKPKTPELFQELDLQALEADQNRMQDRMFPPIVKIMAEKWSNVQQRSTSRSPEQPKEVVVQKEPEKPKETGELEKPSRPTRGVRESAHVPWELIDELDAEKQKLKTEHAVNILFHKFSHSSSSRG